MAAGPKFLLVFDERILQLARSRDGVHHNITSNQIWIRGAWVWGKFASPGGFPGGFPGGSTGPTCGQKANKEEETHMHQDLIQVQANSNWCLHYTEFMEHI